MIKSVEVNDVEFTVDFDAYGEQPSSLYDPGEPKYMEFNSVTIVVGDEEIDIWSSLSEATLDKIENELWELLDEN